MRLGLLILATVLVAAFLTHPTFAKGGGGGHAGGSGAVRGGSGGHESGAQEGGGAAKPSGSKEAETPSSSESGTGDEAPPQAVGSRSNPYYGSPGYGRFHNSLSNFFLWYWLFHPHHRCDPNNDNEVTQSSNQSSSEAASERCDYDYQYRYGGQPNYGVEGWAVLAVLGAAAVAVFFVIKKYRGLIGGK